MRHVFRGNGPVEFSTTLEREIAAALDRLEDETAEVLQDVVDDIFEDAVRRFPVQSGYTKRHLQRVSRLSLEEGMPYIEEGISGRGEKIGRLNTLFAIKGGNRKRGNEYFKKGAWNTLVRMPIREGRIAEVLQRLGLAAGRAFSREAA